MAFKMKGPSLYKNGASLKVQKDYSGQADGRATSSPFQQKEGEKQKEKPKLNQWGETPEQYEKRVEEMGLRKPDKKSDKKTPLEQRVTKGGEGQDENKIFNKGGNHVGDWVDGKKVMKVDGKKVMKNVGKEAVEEMAISLAGKKMGKTLTSNLKKKE
mgnify:CR=1 FL=1